MVILAIFPYTHFPYMIPLALCKNEMKVQPTFIVFLGMLQVTALGSKTFSMFFWVRKTWKIWNSKKKFTNGPKKAVLCAFFLEQFPSIHDSSELLKSWNGQVWWQSSLSGLRFMNCLSHSGVKWQKFLQCWLEIIGNKHYSDQSTTKKDE